MIELNRLYRDAAEQVQRQARGGGSDIEGQDAAAAAQPESSVGFLRQALATERARRLGARDWDKAFSVEPGWPGRGDGPQPLLPVLMAEPHRVGGQALGRGVGRKGAATVAQQPGSGRDPQRTGSVLQQVINGVALELRRILRVEGDKVDAVKPDQASVCAQP